MIQESDDRDPAGELALYSIYSKIINFFSQANRAGGLWTNLVKYLTRIISFQALNIFLVTCQTRTSSRPAPEKETVLKKADNQSLNVIQRYKRYVAYSLAPNIKYMFNVKPS